MNPRTIEDAIQPRTTGRQTIPMPALSDPETALDAGGFLRRVSPVDYDEICRASRLASAAGVGLLLSGRTGCGKTLAIRCLAPPPPPYPSPHRWIYFDNPVQVGWLLDADLLRGIKALVLDDVGMEGEKNNFGEWVSVFPRFLSDFQRRIDRGERVPRLFVTTNLDVKAMMEEYGDRAMSRLLSMCQPVAMLGRDHRKILRAGELPAV